MKRLAALLTVHNRKEKTLQCLRNIGEQKYDKEKYEVNIYLTDDGCTDGTPETVRQKFPEVHIIKGDGSLFWNRGMVAAWKEAAKSDYDYYLWLNDDTYLYADALERMLNTSEQVGGTAIVVGSTCAIGKPDIITYGGRIAGDLVTDVREIQGCTSMNGNIVLVPQTVFHELGFLDSHYRHALGDFDYGLQATRKGVPIYIGEGVFGECDAHDRPTVWKDPTQPFNKRWKNFFSPTGDNPFEFFYFRRKNYGLMAACSTFVSNFLHFLIPRLWKKSYKGYSIMAE